MKKFLLSLAVLTVTAVTASAQWAVVGSYSDPSWNFEASAKFSGEGDNLTCVISNLTSDFKIVDITNNNWDDQYGTATPIEIGKEYTLDGKNGGADPSNITFATPVLAVKNATVSWNPTTHVLKVSGADSDIVKGFPTLYATGSFCEWNTPGEGGSILCDEKDGIYTVKINLGDASETEFKLAGAGWSNEIAGGATVTADAAVEVTKGGGNLKTSLKGEQTLTFNMNTMLMTFGDPALTQAEEKPARTWALVGSYSNPSWNFEASTTFSGEGNNLTCTIDNLFGDFKIVDITNNNWDIQYGTATPIVIGEEYKLNPKEGGQDPSNIAFASPVLAVKNATVNWNPTTAIMKITAAESDIVKGLPTLYVTGSFCEWNSPGEGGSVLCVENDGIYTATIDLGDATETEFKLAGTGWSNEIAGGVTIEYNPVAVTLGGENLKTNLTGKQVLVFNYNEMTMHFDDGSGVSDIEAQEPQAEYFTLQGIRVENPTKGLYIVKKSNKAEKIIL